MTLCMFWTVFPSIISSSRLYIQHQAFAVCLLAGTRWNQFHLVPASKQTAVYVWQMPVAVCTVLNCWWWMERPSETFSVIPKYIKFDTLVHLVGFTIEIILWCMALWTPTLCTILINMHKHWLHIKEVYSSSLAWCVMGIGITKWQNFDIHTYIYRSTKNNSWFEGGRISYNQVL